MKIKILIIIAAAIFALGIVGSILVLNAPEKDTAVIKRDNKILYTIDLKTAEDKVFDIKYKDSKNTVEIKDGKIRVTYTVQNYDILEDISGGWLTVAAADQKTLGDSKRKQDDKTNPRLYNEQWEIAKHYPFVEKDAQKRTCAKALVMTHAYSNALIDKLEEAMKNGIVGGDDDEW